MIKIKVTKITLSPLSKTEDTYTVEDLIDLDDVLVDILKEEVTPKENLSALVKKFNGVVKRYNNGKAKDIFIYTHPAEGIIQRIIFDISKIEKIGKEIGKLL